MRVPAWPGLSPALLFRRPSGAARPFPLGAASGIHFYVARYGIYQLFRSLGLRGGERVLVPDYHHGNEVRAIRAAGAPIRFYPITRTLEPDLDRLARLCADGARVLYVIHYLGWPQPMREIAALCRERGLILIEDCALALLSAPGGKPLGSSGGYSIFCLYKTLPVPNGGLLIRNRGGRALPEGLSLRACGAASLAGRMSELILEWAGNRAPGLATPLFGLKRAGGRLLSTLRMRRVPVGDSGFDPSDADLGASRVTLSLLPRFDYGSIRRARRRNFRLLSDLLGGMPGPLRRDLDAGVCPLFFPLVVRDKAESARALRARGIEAVEFWNRGDAEAERESSGEARFLREHLLELPIHQDITPAQVEYMAEQVRVLNPGWPEAATRRPGKPILGAAAAR